MDCPPILLHSWTVHLFKALEVWGGFSEQCRDPLERKWSKGSITYPITGRITGGVTGDRKVWGN